MDSKDFMKLYKGRAKNNKPVKDRYGAKVKLTCNIKWADDADRYVRELIQSVLRERLPQTIPNGSQWFLHTSIRPSQ
eukprot:6738267-Ditylum_brightwellii.AAC.1